MHPGELLCETFLLSA